MRCREDGTTMDHHTSWLHFLPGFQNLHAFFNERYKGTVVLGDSISTVHHIYAALIVIAILAVLALLARGRLSNLEEAVIPPKTIGVTSLLETFVEGLMGLMASIIGPHYKKHVPFVGTLGLFVLVSNLLGLVPGMLPPTDNLNTTLACGLVVFVYFNVQGILAHGFGHFEHLAFPAGRGVVGWALIVILLPVEVVSLCVRPITLAIRLCANMIGDHAVLLGFAGIMPFLLPLPFYVLGFLVCIIQAAVFCILTCVYISLHTAEHHDDHGEAHAHT
jgi:F-type H+-transporting ATPase subunit a